MEAAAPPRRDIDIGRVFGEVFSIYGKHAVPLLGVALVVFIVIGIVSALVIAANAVVGLIVAVILGVLGITLYTGFLVKLVEDVRDGRRDSTVGELLSAAAPAIPGLIGNGILKAIAVAIGFVLLIVPGLILITIWAVTAPAIVVERRGAIEAFGRSRELVRGNGWTVFAIIAITYVVTRLVSYLFGGIGDGIGDEAGAVILQTIADVITAPVAGLVGAILFFDLGGGSTAPAAAAAPAEPPPPVEPPPPAAPAP
jgi:hypothetical protein